MFNAFLRVLILISFLNASRKFLFYEVNESKALFFTYSTLLNQLNNSDHYLFNNWISDKSASKKNQFWLNGNVISASTDHNNQLLQKLGKRISG